jgi:hypothetical protein
VVEGSVIAKEEWSRPERKRRKDIPVPVKLRKFFPHLPTPLSFLIFYVMGCNAVGIPYFETLGHHVKNIWNISFGLSCRMDDE